MDEHPSDFWLVWNPMGGNPAYRHLEPAARALLAFDSPGTDWDDLSPDDRETYLDGAKRIVEARYPELTEGSHWIAPRTPTDAMLNAGCDLIDDPSSNAVDAVYTVMRNAYLKDKTE